MKVYLRIKIWDIHNKNMLLDHHLKLSKCKGSSMRCNSRCMAMCKFYRIHNFKVVKELKLSNTRAQNKWINNHHRTTKERRLQWLVSQQPRLMSRMAIRSEIIRWIMKTMRMRDLRMMSPMSMPCQHIRTREIKKWLAALYQSLARRIITTTKKVLHLRLLQPNIVPSGRANQVKRANREPARTIIYTSSMNTTAIRQVVMAQWQSRCVMTPSCTWV